MPEYMDELLRSVIMDVALGDISPHQGARRITKTHTDIDRYLRSMPTPQAVYDVFRGVTGLDHEDPDIIDAIDKITETWKLLH